MAVGLEKGESRASAVVLAELATFAHRGDAHEGLDEVVSMDLAFFIVNEAVKEQGLGQGKEQGQEYDKVCQILRYEMSQDTGP